MFEQVIIEEVVATIALDFKAPADRSKKSEGDRVIDMLRRACSVRKDRPIIINNKSHVIVASAPIGGGPTGSDFEEKADGSCLSKIIIAPMGRASPSHAIGIKVSKSVDLTVTTRPWAMLVGADVAPTIAHRGETLVFPSSEHAVNTRLYALGFDFIDALPPLIDDAGHWLFERQIKDADIEIDRIKFSAFLAADDPPRAVRFIPLMFGHTVGDGQGVQQLGDYLGVACQFRSASNGGFDVALKKLQGKRVLFSVKFSAENKRVRLEITVHPDGLRSLQRTAQRRLGGFLKRDPRSPPDWVEEFLRAGSVTAESLAYTTMILANDRINGPPERSFGDYLVPWLLKDIFRLGVITGFKRADLESLAARMDDIVQAWRDADPVRDENWAEVISEEAECSAQTVRNHCRDWIKEYGIDISIPYAFYRDFSVCASLGAANPHLRSELLTAVSDNEPDRALKAFAEAIGNFDEERCAFGAAIRGALGQIPVRAAEMTFELPVPSKSKNTARTKSTSKAKGAKRVVPLKLPASINRLSTDRAPEARA